MRLHHFRDFFRVLFGDQESDGDHVIGELHAVVLLEIEFEFDGLVLLMHGLVSTLLSLVGHPKAKVDDFRVGGIDGEFAVQHLELEAGILGEELVREKLLHRWPLVLVQLRTLVDDVANFGILDLFDALRPNAVDDLLVDLRRPRALRVWILGRGHFEHTHAEGVNVDALIVMLVVHFGRHKFGRADDALGEALVLQGGKTQIADLNGSRWTRNENVVALQVSVYDRRRPRV